jgi:hypothetical protein
MAVRNIFAKWTPAGAHIHVWTWDALGLIEQCRTCGAVKQDNEESE